MSWPIQELAHLAEEALPLDWNDPLRIDEAIQAIQTLRLPVPEIVAAHQWRDILGQVWAYVDNIALPGVDSSVLVSELRSVLVMYNSAVLIKVNQNYL